MSELTRQYITNLRKNIVSSFDLEELETLAFDVGLDWDELFGRTKTAKTHALLLSLAQQGALSDLVTILGEERPHVHWEDAPATQQQLDFSQGRAVAAETALLAMSESVNLMNEIGDVVVQLATGAYPIPAAHRQMIEGEQAEIVSRWQGQTVQKITADDFARLLRPEDLEHITVLERSMQNHYRQWQKLYPRRASSTNAEEAGTIEQRLNTLIAAIAQDLDQILTFLQSLGFMLDDHYMRYRDLAYRTRR